MLDPTELLQVDMERHWNYLDLLRLHHIVRWADDWVGWKFRSPVYGRSSRRSCWSLPIRSRDTLDLRSDNLSESRFNAGPRDCLQPLDSSTSGLPQRFHSRYQQNTFHFKQKQLISTRIMDEVLAGFSGFHRRQNAGSGLPILL